jgi:hypothetical protein
LTTGVSVTIKDQYTNPYEGVLVQALRYYDDEAAYKLVTSGYTDDGGIVVLQLELNKFYKFIIYTDDGNYEYTYWITGNKEIIINPATC